MAFSDVAEMAADEDLLRRLYACAATMGIDNGGMWVNQWVWAIVARDPAWQGAWSAAAIVELPADGSEVAPELPRRGWDASVISDEMIRSRVDEVLNEKGRI